ncbi:MAG: DUF3782 domain-containing protein [Deltaproteobacteria bacterium]|nr:DUF3782 domain-containing protein [Deltaproteobacteria bacterium]
MENQEVIELIRQELPGIMQRHTDIREWVLKLTRVQYADKQETESRIERILDELRLDREENARKWEANQKTINEMLAAIKAQADKHESSIGALGARWGLYSEESFRNGLKAILEKSFGVEVLNVNEYDETGEVFGHPDQVELDIIIQNGLLILCEIKSSISKGDMYIFERKTAFYEKRHNQKATRKMVISPMVDDRARQIAQKLGIEIYTHGYDVKPDVLT